MTEEELKEKEIQARVEFKINEFRTALRNKVRFKYQQVFDMTRESQYAWQAMEEIEKMITKEMYMPLPVDNMIERRKWEAKEKAIDELKKNLDQRGRNNPYKISNLVSIIEKAQNY